MQRKLKAKVMSCGLVVNVYQAKPGDKYFIDEDNNPYTSEELDFTVEQDTKDIHSDDPIVQISKIFEIPKQEKSPDWGEITEKSNQSNLKFERAKSEINKEETLINFQCDMVRILVSKMQEHYVISEMVDSIMDTVHQFSKHIFRKETI
jgi:hypothetical protein